MVNIPWDDKPTDISPEDFELQVKAFIEAALPEVIGYDVTHRETLVAPDGAYEIDVTVRFRVGGADFLVLVECKAHNSAIKREVVQVLHDKVRSTGAHKGIVFATVGFQSGAIEYATQHGMGLVRVASGQTIWNVRSRDSPQAIPTEQLPDFVGWMPRDVGDGKVMQAVIAPDDAAALRTLLIDTS